MDSIECNILANGYIYNDQIWRKKMTAQMIRYGCTPANYNKHFIIDKPYLYEWTSARNEINMISKMSVDEKDKCLRFFNESVVIEMALHYKTNICFVRNKNRSISLCNNVISAAKYVQSHGCKSMRVLTKAMDAFIADAVFPKNMIKSASWKNAFIGTGSYHAMDYLIKFQNCHIIHDNTELDAYSSLSMLDEYVNNCKNKYDALYTIMNSFMSYNHMDIVPVDCSRIC